MMEVKAGEDMLPVSVSTFYSLLPALESLHTNLSYKAGSPHAPTSPHSRNTSLQNRKILSSWFLLLVL